MALSSEISSLDEIHYKSKLKFILYFLLSFFLFTMAFLNFYPVGEKLKTMIKVLAKNSPNCNPSFDQIRMEWFLPKVIVTDLKIPAACLGREGEDLKFNFLKMNYHFITFSPFGLPFRIDTEIGGQPISVYFVQGIGNKQMIRLKDQNLVLNRLHALMGQKVKLAGSVTVDLNLQIENQLISSLSAKIYSKDFQVPSQSIEIMGLPLTVPNLKINTFFLDATSEVPPRVKIASFRMGDPESPIRTDFKGTLDLMSGNLANSTIQMSGEIGLSESFNAQTFGALTGFLSPYPQKDGFYQLKLGGTLGAMRPMQ